jgi:hypothetical protein
MALFAVSFLTGETHFGEFERVTAFDSHPHLSGHRR